MAGSGNDVVKERPLGVGGRLGRWAEKAASAFACWIGSLLGNALEWEAASRYELSRCTLDSVDDSDDVLQNGSGWMGVFQVNDGTRRVDEGVERREGD